MKSPAVGVRLAIRFGIGISALLLIAPAFSQTATAVAANATASPSEDSVPHSANEAAGLPDLDAINRPAGSASATVDLNTVREPSFHTNDHGTEVTEYRDHGKSTEIDVRSNFGTRYQMSAPTDISPRVPSNGAPNGRVPSIKLTY